MKVEQAHPMSEAERASEEDSLSKEVSDPKLGEGLPCLDETHLRFNEAHLSHVLVGFQDPG